MRLAVPGMVDCHNHPPMTDLGVLRNFLQPQDRFDTSVDAAEDFQPLRQGPGFHDLADLMHHEILDLFGGHVPSHEIFSSDRLAESFPEFLLERADTQVAAIRGSVNVIAGQLPGKRESGSNSNILTRKET